MPFFGVPIRNGLPIGLGSVAGFGAPQEFSPSELFLGGTAGAWYDPSDLSTLFTTSAGTTQCAMPGLGAAVPVGLMLDKSQGLVLGSELAGSILGGTSGWTFVGAATVSGGAVVFTTPPSTNASAQYNPILTSGSWYRVQITLTGTGQVTVQLGSAGTSATFTAPGSYSFTGIASGGTPTVLTFSSVLSGVNNFVGSVTAVSVRTLPGNHAIAFNNTTARPELRARVNLLTYSEEFNLWSSAGTTVSANATTAPNGTLTADKMVETATTGVHYRLVGSLTTQVTSYTLSVSAKAAERKWLILWYSGSGGFEPYAYFDLENGVIGNKSVSAVASILPQSNGFYRCQITITGQAISNASFVVSVSDADNNNPNQTYLGDSSKGIFVWGADLRPANIGANVPAYQRIADALTYDTSGFPLYLRFDGIDDSMYTPANLNLSGTDKVAVFAGVRRLTNTDGCVTELTSGTTNGFNLFASTIGGNSWFFSAWGATQLFGTAAPYNAPITNVLTEQLDKAAATDATRISARVNAAAVSLSYTGSLGTPGNFANAPLYIGARGGNTIALNGHIYSLIIAGSAVSAGNISATEQWVAGKVGLALP